MLATTSAASAAVLEVAVEEGRWRLLGGVVGLAVALAVILVVGGRDYYYFGLCLLGPYYLGLTR